MPKRDKSGEKMAEVLSVFLVFLVCLYMTPTVMHEVDSSIFENAHLWNFTAHEGAEAILGLSGFVWVIVVVVALVGGVYAVMKWT